MVNGQQCKMIMTSVSGHLLNQSFIGNYKKWHACNPLDLFDAPVVKICLPDGEPIKVCESNIIFIHVLKILFYMVSLKKIFFFYKSKFLKKLENLNIWFCIFVIPPGLNNLK